MIGFIIVPDFVKNQVLGCHKKNESMIVLWNKAVSLKVIHRRERLVGHLATSPAAPASTSWNRIVNVHSLNGRHKKTRLTSASVTLPRAPRPSAVAPNS